MDNKKLGVGIHYEPSNVGRCLGSGALALQMTNAIFDTLVNRTRDDRHLPGLAESFDIGSGRHEYVIV